MSYSASEIIIYKTDNIQIPDIHHAIISNRKDWLSRHYYNDDLILYHYTNLEGIRGIITERAIRCTQFDYLNDPLELQYGRELIIQKLKYFRNIERNLIITNFLNDLINDSGSLGKSPSHSIFMASFCDNGNLLSQWRGYASRGCGYNLGISLDSDTQACDDLHNPVKFYLRKIIYEFDEQESMIEFYLSKLIDAISSSIKSFENYSKIDRETILSKIGLHLKNLLVDIIISLKNPVYAREKEWRLIRVIRWDELTTIINFRGKNDELIPYVNTIIFNRYMDSLNFPLCKIKFGPMLDNKKTQKALELFVQNSLALENIIKLKDDIIINDSGYELND